MAPSRLYAFFFLLVGCLLASCPALAEPIIAPLYVSSQLATGPGSLAYSGLDLLWDDWGASPDPCFPAVFAFGDSLTDTGNYAHILRRYGDPVDLGFSPADAYLTRPRDIGNCKDGRLIIDFIAQALGFAPPSPYMQAVGPNFQHGANFATYGATATSMGFLSPYNLDTQTFWLARFKANVLEPVSARKASGSDSASQPLLKVEDFEKGLYYIAIGGNDYTAMATMTNHSFLMMGAQIPLVLAKLESTILSLLDSGARNFLIVNLPPLGCSTAFVDSYTRVATTADLYLAFDDNDCIRPFNDVVQLHNSLLRDMLPTFRARHPNATFIYADYYGVIRHMLLTAETEGSEELPGSIADLRSGCASSSESLGGCYSNVDINIVSDAANKLATRSFLSGQFVEPQWAFDHCQFNFGFT